MKKFFLLGFFISSIIVGLYAQKTGYDPINAPYGHGQDSTECLQNLSLMQTSCKAEDFAGALKPWREAFDNCPGSSKNIYIYGSRIIKFYYQKETDAAKKKEYLDKLINLYDVRMKYFGADHPKGDAKGSILAYKARDYMDMVGNDADQKLIYEWLSEAVNEMKEKLVPLDTYSYFMYASLSEFLKDNSLKERYLADYFKVSDYVDKAIANAKSSGDKDSEEYLLLVKDGIVKGFVNSGAGDCKTLAEYYADKVEPNKTNKPFLTDVVNALGVVGCTDTDIYFTAAEHLYQLEPSADAAIGLANKSLRDKDYDTAVKYYGEAAKLETDKEKASNYLYQLAGIFSNQRNFSKARQAAYEALEYNPSNGSCYILIAQLYATSANNIFPEPEKAGLVYCAAVDKLQKAKSVDPSVADEANRLISRYSAGYMDRETAFFMGYKSGDPVFIPGWIGENTTVRLR